ncbi:MAG: PAS domain S-box protein [Desulfotignum sp.]|nr:PAS domain S-box protein [Desulfotignum sp.]MCF8139197.1 PAS domain S-box protein [Desulfotignum sp.]
MTASSFIGLINNAALLMALALVYDVSGVRPPGRKYDRNQLFIGAVLSVIGVLIMLTPWEFTSGVIFDTRSILLSITGLFFGTIPTVIVILITGAYRFLLGGAGAWTGFAVIATSGAVGLLWRHRLRNKWETISFKQLYLMGLATHVLMLLWMLTLPKNVAFEVLSAISLPVILLFPPGTVLLGLLLINRRNRINAVAAVKKNEKELQEALLRQKEAIKAGKVGLWDWDLVTDKVHYSKEWKRQIGYKDHEISDDFEEWKSRVHPEDLAPTQKKIQQMNGDVNKEFVLEFRFRHRDGSYRWILAQASILPDETGRPARMVGSHVDITERKNMEENLEKERQFLNQIMETSPVAIAVVNRDGQVTRANAMAEKTLGIKKSDIYQRTYNDPEWRITDFHGNKIPDEKMPFQIVKATRKAVYGIEHAIEWPDGNRIFLSINSAPLFDSAGDFDGSVSAMENITDRKNAEAEREMLQARLRQSRKMESIGTLAGGIAHEFNNMLGIIIGNSELALDHIPEQSPAEECIQEIRTASLRAKDVVRNLLSVARETPTSRESIQISPIIKESLDLMKKTIPAEIDFRQNIRCTTEMISGNPDEINQVLMNLVANSVHAMKGQTGILEVTLEAVQLDHRSAIRYENLEPGGYARLTVKDSGHGIAPELIEQIFDPYFTTKEVDEGLGMGLAVVHGIVKKHDGAIKIESASGKGTTAMVLFPLERAVNEL